MAKESQRIIVIGAGEVGFHAAEVLLHEDYDITLIDRSRERLEEVEDILDVQTLAGFGADPDVLAKAEAHNADLILAVTDNDEVNILAAHIAKQLGTRVAVARSRNQSYVGSSKISLQRSLNLDLLISPEKLTAFEMAKFVDNPDIQAFQYFAMGRVEMQRIQLTQESFVINQPLNELQMPGVLILLISRDEDLIVPTGQDMLQPGDVVTAVGESDQIHLLQSLFHFPDEKPQRVIIAGGGTVGATLAQVLETRQFNVSLIEKSRARAERLSETLSRTTIVNGDATRLSFVKEERIG